ncbi:MAG: hypothetical protein IPH44_13130 [Myxococcales bacterium]|nr:hypothetical protein [Myxococcales bacterium]MBP6848794.1 hypothetical protein [Kofleriaceae bacterium]
MVAPLQPLPRAFRDGRLDASLTELLEVHHPALRGLVAALAAARAHVASHGPKLPAAVDRVEAIIGAALAREARVIAPHLRTLAGGTPDRSLFDSVAALAPVLTGDQQEAATAVAALLVALMVHETTCPACAAAAEAAERLTRALVAHRTFTIATLLPRARARELALGRAPTH